MKCDNDCLPIRQEEVSMGEIVAGILYGARRRIERILREKQAFDEKTAVSPEETGITEKEVLVLMEKGGLITRTQDGKMYLIPKGKSA